MHPRRDRDPPPARSSLNADAEAVTLTVANTGDRPVQVGSHYHFAEANPALEFDRAAAHGRRLDIPAGTRRALRAGAGARRRARPLWRRAAHHRVSRRGLGATGCRAAASALALAAIPASRRSGTHPANPDPT